MKRKRKAQRPDALQRQMTADVEDAAGQLMLFVSRGRGAQRAIDKLGAGRPQPRIDAPKGAQRE